VGLGAYVNGLYVESADAYTRLQTDYPEHRWDAVGYWRGRALQAIGDREAARATWQALVERAPDMRWNILVQPMGRCCARWQRWPARPAD
jgi:soluble lytic murein transglycosylase